VQRTVTTTHCDLCDEAFGLRPGDFSSWGIDVCGRCMVEKTAGDVMRLLDKRKNVREAREALEESIRFRREGRG
jgi:hypothetical protein